MKEFIEGNNRLSDLYCPDHCEALELELPSLYYTPLLFRFSPKPKLSSTSK